jgi:hypothetical protein
MTFLRNLARVLRDEDGAIDQETLALAFGATLLALGGLTLAITGSVGWALVAVALGIPLQLTGMAYRPTALVVAGIGTILVGGAATVITAFLARLFLLPNPAWASWLAGGIIGLIGAGVTGYGFRHAIQKLNKPGWY